MVWIGEQPVAPEPGQPELRSELYVCSVLYICNCVCHGGRVLWPPLRHTAVCHGSLASTSHASCQ